MYRVTEVSSNADVVTLYNSLSTYLLLFGIPACYIKLSYYM